MRLEATRDEAAKSDLQAAFANKKDADITPVSDAIASVRGSPDWRRPAIRRAVNSVEEMLKDGDGFVKDPEQLYGVRKHIDDMLSKEGRAAEPLNARAQASLMTVKTAIDEAIEGAAPGFRKYLDNYSAASRPIDEMEALQPIKNAVMNGSTMSYAKFQQQMRKIVDMRDAPGINPYKSIGDETMQKLWAIRDDLRRSDAAQTLARTAGGSDTAQNFVDMLKQWGSQAALHGAANMASPGIGSLVVNGIQGAARPLLDARRNARLDAEANALLRPKTPLRDPFRLE
jgi:hypothetical protein